MTAAPRALQVLHRDELDQTLGQDPFAYAKQTGREQLEDHFRSFADALRSEPGGSIREDLVIERLCPLCKKTKGDFRFDKYGFSVRYCGGCRFEFSSPMLDDQKVVQGNIDDETLSHSHLSFVQQPRYRAAARLRFEYEIQQLLAAWSSPHPPRTFLEVGCSTGTGLEVAQGYGLEVTGVEPNREAASVAKASGFDVVVDLFGRGVLGDRTFDLIMTLDVLEHVPDPVEFLAAAREALAPGGLLFVQVPNAGALMTWMKGASDQIYNGLIHLNYFDSASLNLAAERAGLQVVSVTSILSELGKLKQYSEVQIKASLLEHAPHLLDRFRLHQDFINDNNLGYKLLGIYRN